MRNLAVLIASVLVTVLAGAEETAYVTDMLRLGVHAAEDAGDAPIVTVPSGTRLEVLERRADIARVRTPSGEVGWVGSAYLVADKPAVLRVAEAEKEVERLAAAVSGSEGLPATAIHDTLERLKRENQEYQARLDSYRASLPISWIILAVAVALIGGFLAGLWCLDRVIRKRYGGFRPY